MKIHVYMYVTYIYIYTHNSFSKLAVYRNQCDFILTLYQQLNTNSTDTIWMPEEPQTDNPQQVHYSPITRF